MVGKKDKAASGPPRWTYVVGALVAVGGLIWGMVSYFIPKPQLKPLTPVEQVALPRQEAKAEGGTAINASDAARVTIGPSATPDAAGGTTPNASTTTQVDQSVEAGREGIGVNASGSAEVMIDSAEQDRK